ncbi:MAG: Carboxyl-terminal protease [uncultured bacterium]|nr:MAG: Carboxyl-terminal protease [uncultured bacterium]
MSERNGCAWFLFGIIGLAFASVMFVAGFAIGKWQNNSWFEQHGLSLTSVNAENNAENSNKAMATQPDSDLFWQVWDEVQNNYIGQPIEDKTLFYGAVAGIAQSVNDPYTVYMNPTDAKKFQEVISGEFEGIGAEIGSKDGQIVVIAP